MPFCGANISSNGTILNVDPSVEISIILELSKIYNFKVKFVDANLTWGNEINGTMTGAVGMVAYKVRQNLSSGIKF